jgi:hypothetical protein
MKKIIIVCLTSLFVVFSLNLTAQSFFDVARLDVIQIPTSYKGDGQSFDVREVSGALNLGFKTVGEDRLLLSWNGERRCIHLDGEAPYQKPLFLNVASLGYIRSWPESPWRLLMMSRLKLGSDYDILTSEDLSWGFLAAATYTSKKGQSFTIGGHYGEELFGPLIFPIFGMDVQLTDRAYFYAFFPAEVRMEYALKPQKLYTSLVLNWMTNSYGLHNVSQATFIRTEELMLRAFLDLNVSKNLVLFGAFGHTLINNYELRSDGNERLFDIPFDQDFKNGWILDFGLAFRLRFKN